MISPVFICLFWAMALMADRRKFPAPRRFLAIFLLFTAFIFTAHFLYFAAYPDIYPWFDIPLQWIAMFIFPLFHIYFRLLTVDDRFSFRKHIKYLAIPFFVGLNYFIAVMMTPHDDYLAWLFKGPGIPVSGHVYYLELSRTVIRVVFPVLLMLALIANYRLIQKHGKRMGEFFSDVHDEKNRAARILNFSILGISLVSLVITTMGRDHVMSDDRYIYFAWSGFSVILYTLGLLGMSQRPINPAYDPAEVKQTEYSDLPVPVLNDLAERIKNEFKLNKIHLDNELNIMDVAKAIGTNRSYISSTINKRFNQNFSVFVNSYRIEEFKLLSKQDRKITAEALANNCGFGSVNSMKRAILSQTGLTFSAMRKKIREDC